MRRAPKGQGKLAEKFKSMLESELGEGWHVERLWPAQGHWLKEDVYRVEGQVSDPNGHTVCFGSWEKMSTLVKQGLHVTFDTFTIEVWAK